MKKNLYTLALLLLSFCGSAQTYTEQQDSLLQHLNKELVSTGVLYDRVYPWASLSTVQEGPVNVDYDHARQAWLELELASYNKETVLTLEEAKSRIRQNDREGKGISIGIIDYDFNSIDSNAFGKGALLWGEDSLVYDGEGNAYLNHRITLPIVSAKGLRGEVAKFYFDPELLLSNTGRQPTGITISIEGSEEQLTVSPGEDVLLPIGGISDSIIRATVHIYFDNVLLPGEFVVEWGNGNLVTLSGSFSSDECVEDGTIWSGEGLKFKGYDENVASQGYGNYRIFHRQIGGSWTNCATDVRKPIIIIDGFDPGDEREITQSYKNDKTYDGIWDLLKYGNNKHLGDELRKEGFDVIVLNFPMYQTFETGADRDGGADYIERNAMVLVKLIQEINTKLAQSGSSEKIVVVGPSMGGQVARFGLAYMEKEGLNHNTRLYVSFDSPHKGANIPISAQQALHSLGYINNQEMASTQYEEQLRSKAARQLLIEQMDGLNKSASFHQTYYNNLNTGGLPSSQGWPVNLRKISLINGNANGVNTNGAGNKILFGQAYAVVVEKGIELNLYNMPNYGNALETYNGMNKSIVFGIGAFSSNTPINFNTPNMTGSIQTNFVANPTLLGLWGFQSKRVKINVTNQNSNGSMDIVPGGTYKTIAIVKERINDFLRKKWYVTQSSITWNNVKDYHCFIPSVSSLAFKNTNFNWSTPFNNRNLVCTGEIPFDAYYTAPNNEEHVSLTEASAKWAMQEIQKGKPGCTPICFKSTPYPNDLITPLCINTTRRIYHNLNMPTGSTVSWSVADNPYALEIITAQTNNSYITVKGTDDYDSAVIRYTVNNPCGANVEGSFVLNAVGQAQSGLRIYAIDSNTNAAKVAYYRPASNTYSWSYNNGPYGHTNAEIYPGTFPTSNDYNPNPKQICLKSVNVCGTSIHCGIPSIPANPLSVKVEAKLTVFPNPTQTEWNVTYTTGTGNYSLYLYNSMGTLVWSGKSVSIDTSIPAEHLASGLYILKVQSANNKATIKLMKQ